jgi:hypothetical protein
MIDLARLLGQITAAALVGLGIGIVARTCGARPKHAAAIGVVSGSSLFINTVIRVWGVGEKNRLNPGCCESPLALFDGRELASRNRLWRM